MWPFLTASSRALCHLEYEALMENEKRALALNTEVLHSEQTAQSRREINTFTRRAMLETKRRAGSLTQEGNRLRPFLD